MIETASRPSPPLRLAVTPQPAGGTALYVAVTIVVLWTPLPFGSVEAWSIGLIRLAACLLAVLWAFHGARTGAFVVSTSLLQAPLYGAAAWALLQTLPFGGSAISVDPFLTSQAAVNFAALAVFTSCALIALDSTARLERAGMILFWFGFVLSVFGIIQNFTGTRSLYWIRESPVESFFGPFVNKNHFAGLIEILLPLGLGPLISGAVPRERRLMLTFVAATMVAAVALSRSRGGLLAVVAEIALLVALSAVARRSAPGDRRTAPALAAVAASIVLVGAVVAWLSAGPIVESLAELPAEISSTAETSRGEIWKATISLIGAHPVTGSGFGAYGTAILRHWPSTEYSTLLYAHDDYLQVVADGGIPGALLAILFVGVVGTSLVRAVRIGDPGLRGVALGAGAGCVGLLIHSVVDFNLQIPSNAIAFLFASAMVVRASSIGAPAGARQ